MAAALTRRSALAAAVALITYRAAPVAAAPIHAAIRRAEAADATDREAGRHARALQCAGRPVPAGWKSYRAGLRQARTVARFDLHSLTPSTAEAATALVAYYRDRAAASGEPATAHYAAQRRLRKVFRRPGAVACPADLARASPA